MISAKPSGSGETLSKQISQPRPFPDSPQRLVATVLAKAKPRE